MIAARIQFVKLSDDMDMYTQLPCMLVFESSVSTEVSLFSDWCKAVLVQEWVGRR